MKKVLKYVEPQELINYKQRFYKQFRRWNNLKDNRETLNAIRNILASDQKGLCAYCEMSLHEKDRSVEHFIPRHCSNAKNNYDLDWQNMLAICKGGLQNVDIPGEDDSLRNSRPPDRFPCCGAAKVDFIPDGQLLNPLELPTSRLFKFSSSDGEIRPDEITCEQVGIPMENVQFTIDKLGLNVQRLKKLRLAIIEEIIKELDERDNGIIDPIDLEEEIAAEYFRNGTGNWPRFFTTLRWTLGEGAERYLVNTSYSG